MAGKKRVIPKRKKPIFNKIKQASPFNKKRLTPEVFEQYAKKFSK